MKESTFKLIFFVAALLILGLSALALNVPFEFNAGETIRASEMNANFDALVSELEAIRTQLPIATSAPLEASVLIGASETVVGTISIDTPGPGYVDLASTGYLSIDHRFGTNSQVRIGIVDASEYLGPLLDGRVVASVPGSTETGIGQTPFAISRLIEKPAGTHTFQLVASASTGSGGSVSVPKSVTLRAIYYPTAP